MMNSILWIKNILHKIKIMLFQALLQGIFMPKRGLYNKE